MQQRVYGTMPNGREIHEYTFTEGDLSFSVINYGARITHFSIGELDVMCGHDSLYDYLRDTSFQGAAIGRFGNRIRHARFSLNGKDYQLAMNNKDKHHLHGGNVGYSYRVFEVAEVGEQTILLTLNSPDGEEGYPGNLTVGVRYTLKDQALIMEYTATSDADTPLNLTNHSYFNLHGCTGQTVLDHTAVIYADATSEVDDVLIPTGASANVSGTAYDFRTPHTFGERMSARFGGYDNNYIIAGAPMSRVAGKDVPLIAIVCADSIKMEVLSDRPCVQLYTACELGGKPDFRGGVPRVQYGAFCLETQDAPDSPNHGEGILRAGEDFYSVTAYRLTRE